MGLPLVDDKGLSIEGYKENDDPNTVEEKRTWEILSLPTKEYDNPDLANEATLPVMQAGSWGHPAREPNQHPERGLLWESSSQQISQGLKHCWGRFWHKILALPCSNTAISRACQLLKLVMPRARAKVYRELLDVPTQEARWWRSIFPQYTLNFGRSWGVGQLNCDRQHWVGEKVRSCLVALEV